MYKQNDVASFPELFDGMEQFLDEQLRRLKRASLWSAMLAATGFALTTWAIQLSA